MRSTLVQETVKEKFDYVDGLLICRQTGRIPSSGSHKKLVVRLNGKNEYHARCVWAWHRGDLSGGLNVYHKDGDVRNDAVENLSLSMRPKRVDEPPEVEESKHDAERVAREESARVEKELLGAPMPEKKPAAEDLCAIFKIPTPEESEPEPPVVGVDVGALLAEAEAKLGEVE